MEEFEKLKKSHTLSNTATDFIDLIYSSGKRYNVKQEVKVHMVDVNLQMIDKNTCRIYQLYFFVNQFYPLEDSSIINEKTLDKNTIDKLLNEISSTNKQNNGNKIESFIEQNDIWLGI